MVVIRAWGRGKRRAVVNGYRVSVGKDENVREVDGGDGCTTI